MSELTPLNTDINREIDKDPFASDCPHHRGHAVDLRSRRRLGRRIVVAHIGVFTNPRDGLPSGDLTRQETVRATADHERPFVLKVQPRQDAKLGRSPVRHGPELWSKVVYG